MTLKDKKFGSFIGLAVGDAMGAPYEFLSGGRYKTSTEYKKGGVHNVSIGEWTDDTSMALCLAQSIIDTKTFDPIDQMTKYLDWYRKGYMCTRDKCFDIGNTTRNSIRAFEHSKLTTPYTNTGTTESDGNGTIMRLSPLVIAFYDDVELPNIARKSSLTTHKGKNASECASLLAEIIRNCYNYTDKYQILYETNDNTHIVESLLKDMVEMKLDENYIITDTIPTGYCIDTLECALKGFVLHNTFIEGLMYCISLGDDTDTVGAVYGQIAGAYYGLSGIPQYYKDNLMRYEEIYDICDKLIETTLIKKDI